MSTHSVTTQWKKTTAAFTYEAYNRDHWWIFDGGSRVQATASPQYRGSPQHVDPEEAFVAALSSCHLLTFLALASKKRFVVESYSDEAIGYLEKNAQGKMAITRVTLQPRVEFSGDQVPTTEEIHALHERAHEECFIANSVKTEVSVVASE